MFLGQSSGLGAEVFCGLVLPLASSASSRNTALTEGALFPLGFLFCLLWAPVHFPAVATFDSYPRAQEFPPTPAAACPFLRDAVVGAVRLSVQALGFC